MTIRVFGVWAVSVLAISTVTACSQSRHAAGSRALNWSQYNAEYLATTRATDLRLPPGVQWPSHAPESPTDNGIPNTFERGVGTGEAHAFWYCSWERRWLTLVHMPDGDASAALSAMKHLAETPYLTQYTVQQDRHIYHDAWVRADLGDPSLIEQDVAANCQGLGLATAH